MKSCHRFIAIRGMTYDHTHAPRALHMHNLAGNRLTLASGRLQAGHVSNTHVVFSNGVFQVGAGATSAEIRLGGFSVNVPRTNAMIKVHGVFETRNRGSISVGYNDVNDANHSKRGMTLDLGAALIVSEGVIEKSEIIDENQNASLVAAARVVYNDLRTVFQLNSKRRRTSCRPLNDAWWFQA